MVQASSSDNNLMNVNESFNLDEIEQAESEKNALIPNTEEVSVCSCRGACLKERGRNACPCKSMGNYCSETCHSYSERQTCMNKQRLIEGESSSEQSSDDSVDLDFQPETELETFDHRPESDVRQTSRGSVSRIRGRGSRGRGSRGRGCGGRIQNQGRELSATGRQPAVRRARGRGGLVPEPNSEESRVAHENQLQNLVDSLQPDILRQLALELLRRQPAVFVDLVNGQIGGVVAGQAAPTEEPPPPGNERPNWCNCGMCREMPTQEENKCCCQREMPCITTQQLFSQLVLDGNVLT